MQPKCFVIAHESSKVYNDCVQSLTQHGWTFEKFKAIDGWSVTEQDWKRIGVKLSQEGKMGRRPGAQGCWMSHWELWNRCVKSGEPLTILEHDTIVTNRWPEDVDISSALTKLYKTAECKIHPMFGKWSKGSHAYTVTPSQAQTLIDYARTNGAQAVDKHLGNSVQPWRFLEYDLCILNSRRGPSITSKPGQY